MAAVQLISSPQYIPPVLKNNSDGWYIEYYALHPQEQTLKRFRIKLNRIRKRYARLADFKAYALTIIAQVSAKLYGGWSPFYEAENVRMYTSLPEAIELYLKEKQRELRPATMRTYKSWCSMFQAWAEQHIPKVYVSLINKVIMVKYMDYLYNERKMNARSWNNNLKQGRCFFNWCIEKCYMKENPLESIGKKREASKTRVIIPPAYREKIAEYFKVKSPNFLTVCKLVFTSLLRPKEIRYLQIKDIHIDEHYIYVSPDKAKNHHGRCAAMNEDIEQDIKRILSGGKYPDSYYLFGGTMTPSAQMCSDGRMRKNWDKMRIAIKLPDEMQLYSLRDTGINNMLKSGIDPLTVMQHADHHDLSMTTRYANHADAHLVDRIRNEAPKF